MIKVLNDRIMRSMWYVKFRLVSWMELINSKNVMGSLKVKIWKKMKPCFAIFKKTLQRSYSNVSRRTLSHRLFLWWIRFSFPKQFFELKRLSKISLRSFDSLCSLKRFFLKFREILKIQKIPCYSNFWKIQPPFSP